MRHAHPSSVEVDALGIKDVRYPVTIVSGSWEVLTIAHVSITVARHPATKAGARRALVELLDARAAPLDQRGFRAMARDMLDLLDARTGTVEMRFPYFISRGAATQGLPSHLDYDVSWRGSIDAGAFSFGMGVAVPVRGCRVSLDAHAADDVRIEELIGIAEQSDPGLTGLHAADFLEELVRGVALALDRDRRISGYTIEAESFEPIRNHSAFARLVQGSPRSRAMMSS
jgi:GTP cyclohydrolase FolE2